MPDSIIQRGGLLLAAILVALGVFALCTALGVGTGKPHPQAAAHTQVPLGTYHARAPHVLSTLVVNSVQGAVSGASSTPPTALPPVPASGFARPISRYKAYAADQLGLMEPQIGRLERALRANDRTGAQDAWRDAYAGYLRLGAVYTTGQVATLDEEIDGGSSGLGGGVKSPRFTGLHRIEYGLWGSAPPRALLAWTRKLDTNVGRLRAALPHVSITPLEYATRAHEILEDAARDLLSGTAVQQSGEGVLGTYAGFEATKEIVQTLRPLLGVREGVARAVEAELVSLGSAFASVAAAHGGHLPRNGELTQHQSEQLDSALAGALEALAQIPGTLETEATPQIPNIPRRDSRIDP